MTTTSSKKNLTGTVVQIIFLMVSYKMVSEKISC